MSDALPTFPYHPDPVAIESVARFDASCVCCGRQRGYIYTGVTYAEDVHDGHLPLVHR